MGPPELAKVYVRYREGIPENEMFYYARQGFWTMGVEAVPFTWVDDIDGMNDLGPTVGISGYIGDVWAGMRRMGRELPPALDYPEALNTFLGRRVWPSTLGEVRGAVEPVFVKPVEQKLFTGFVWQGDRGSRLRVATHADETPVWCSEVVDFVSEYRAFVLYRKAIDLRHYKGDWGMVPNKSTVIAGMNAMGRGAPHAYALDWGVTADGRTLLVEANDGTCLGHYGLNPVSYARMISARWHELAGGGT